MSKEKQQSKKEQQVKQEPIKDYKQFEYGDLYIKCDKCGSDLAFHKGVRGGFQVYLPTTDKHEIVIECSECKNKLAMHWKESENLDELRKKDVQLIQEQLKKIQEQKDQLNSQLDIIEKEKSQEETVGQEVEPEEVQESLVDEEALEIERPTE